MNTIRLYFPANTFYYVYMILCRNDQEINNFNYDFLMANIFFKPIDKNIKYSALINYLVSFLFTTEKQPQTLL